MKSFTKIAALAVALAPVSTGFAMEGEGSFDYKTAGKYTGYVLGGLTALYLGAKAVTSGYKWAVSKKAAPEVQATVAKVAKALNTERKRQFAADYAADNNADAFAQFDGITLEEYNVYKANIA